MTAEIPVKHRTATFIQEEVSEDYGPFVNSCPGHSQAHVFIWGLTAQYPWGYSPCKLYPPAQNTLWDLLLQDRIGQSRASWKPCKQELERGFQRKNQKKVGFIEDKGPVCSCPSLIQHWVAKRKVSFKTILDPTPRCASSFLAHRIMGCTRWVSGKLQLITSLFFWRGKRVIHIHLSQFAKSFSLSSLTFEVKI